MPDTSSILVYMLAVFVLVVIPGPSVLYIIARGASQGPTAGLISAAGVQTGSLVHIAAAVCGVSALLAASATALTFVKLTGGGYLVYLGIRAWRSAGVGIAQTAAAHHRSNRRIFRDGFIVNALNPKTAIFFLAFLPQFVRPEAGSVALQLLVLGAIFVAIGLASDGAYGLVSGLLGDAIRHRRTTQSSPVAGRATGLLYIGLGAVTLLSGGHAQASPVVPHTVAI